jgi:NTE family protein
MRRKWQDALRIGDFDDDVAARVRELTARDYRTRSVLAWGPNARHFEHLLADYLVDKRLCELPKRPDFIFCATDLTHGVNYEFSRTHTGSYRFESPDGPVKWSLAFAVAASACFPPWFGPVPVSGRLLGGKPKVVPTERDEDLLRCTDLSDGGLYDNLGLQPVIETHALMLVSDASAPLDEARISRRPVKRLMRYTSVARRQARSLRVTMFKDDVWRKEFDGALWDIGTSSRVPAVGYSRKVIDECIALVRTDLDHFTEAEQMILENHGYWSMEDQFRQPAVRDRLAAVVDHNPPEASWPWEDWINEDKVRQALRKSHKRFSISRLLGRG